MNKLKTNHQPITVPSARTAEQDRVNERWAATDADHAAAIGRVEKARHELDEMVNRSLTHFEVSRQRTLSLLQKLNLLEQRITTASPWEENVALFAAYIKNARLIEQQFIRITADDDVSGSTVLLIIFVDLAEQMIPSWTQFVEGIACEHDGFPLNCVPSNQEQEQQD